MAVATTVKQNGTAKKTQSTGAVKTTEKAKETSATKKLVKEVIPPIVKPVSLHDRMNNYEKLNGLANQRTRLMTTLTSLTKFKYNNGDSCVFLIRDENGEEFKTTNTNLIQLVTNHLQDTLLHRKEEIEKKIVQFEL